MQIPVVKIDEQYRTVSEPMWLDRNNIISISTRRVSGRSISVFNTEEEIFMLSSGVDDIPKLFSDNGEYINVDRGSIIRKDMIKSVDLVNRRAILKNGEEREVAPARIQMIKELIESKYL